MANSPKILSALSDLDTLCTAGYAMALHISYTTPRFLFQTYNRDWMDFYSKNGLVLKDPTVRWGFENTGTVMWQDLKDQDVDNVLGHAKSYGIKYGFTHSLDIGGSKSITSFARADRSFSEDEILRITQLAEDIHRASADFKEFSSEALDELKRLSIEFTHN